jgi:hypothetical protein
MSLAEFFADALPKLQAEDDLGTTSKKYRLQEWYGAL